MKRKFRQKKSIREIPAYKSFSGEASPYWDHAKNHQRFDHDGQLKEDSIANPDVLSEQDNVFNLYEDENKPIKLQAIREGVCLLSSQQKQILQYCGIKGWTLKKTGQKLGLTIPTVQSYLNIVREKIQKRYIELLEGQEIL